MVSIVNRQIDVDGGEDIGFLNGDHNEAWILKIYDEI